MPNLYDDRYQKLNFPDYEYREYPKMVYPGSPDGKPVTNGLGQSEPGITVLNAEEEASVMATKAPPVRESDERDRLQMICEVKQVKYDKRWGNDKLVAAIVEAGEDPDFDPRQ